MEAKSQEAYIHLFYKAGLLVKGIGAALELIAGIVTIFITPTVVLSVATWLTQDELLEDPNDPIANYFLNAAHQFSINSQAFIVLYLVSHGLVKILTLWALYRNKLWAYPLSLVVFGLFIVYQVYRYSYTGSVWLIVLTVFDLAVMWLIWKEYALVTR